MEATVACQHAGRMKGVQEFPVQSHHGSGIRVIS